MKTLLMILMAMALVALTWISLGWVALLVIPSIGLFALMTFAPLLIARAHGEELGSADPSTKKQSAAC